MFFLLFSQLKSADQNKIGFTFPSKISVCRCVNWQAWLAWIIPAHLDYLLPRQQDAVKGKGVCGKAGRGGNTCRRTRSHPHIILDQSSFAADDIQNASVVGCEQPGFPLTHHVLVAYILPGDRNPSPVI